MPVIQKTRREIYENKQNRAAAIDLTQKRYDERFALDQSKEAGLMDRSLMTIAGEADRQQSGFDNARDVSALARKNLLLDRTETRQNTLDDRFDLRQNTLDDQQSLFDHDTSEKNIDRGIAAKNFKTATGLDVLKTMSDGMALGGEGDSGKADLLRESILRGNSGSNLADIISPAGKQPTPMANIRTPRAVVIPPAATNASSSKKPYSSSLGRSTKLIDTTGTEQIASAVKSPYTAFKRVKKDFNRQGGTSQLKAVANLSSRAKKAANL